MCPGICGAPCWLLSRAAKDAAAVKALDETFAGFTVYIRLAVFLVLWFYTIGFRVVVLGFSDAGCIRHTGCKGLST